MAELIENGYKMCGQRLNEEIDTMIDEVHKAYMNHTDENAKARLDAQMKILWCFKDKIENAIADGMAMPTTTEAEIRAKAISEFAEKLLEEIEANPVDVGGRYSYMIPQSFLEGRIKDVAEQLKGE